MDNNIITTTLKGIVMAWSQRKALAYALVNSGITQTELASRMKVHRQFVYQWKSERRKLNMVVAERISECLGIKLSEFVQLGE